MHVLPWALLLLFSPRDRAVGTVFLALGYLVGLVLAMSIGLLRGGFDLAAFPAHAAYTLGSLGLARQAGYRLAWQPATHGRQARARRKP